MQKSITYNVRMSFPPTDVLKEALQQNPSLFNKQLGNANTDEIQGHAPKSDTKNIRFHDQNNQVVKTLLEILSENDLEYSYNSNDTEEKLQKNVYNSVHFYVLASMAVTKWESEKFPGAFVNNNHESHDTQNIIADKITKVVMKATRRYHIQVQQQDKKSKTSPQKASPPSLPAIPASKEEPGKSKSKQKVNPALLQAFKVVG